jgi:SAM-dependent methyltransferase
MKRFWDERARENAMFFIHSVLAYGDTDASEFWASGAESLDCTLEPFGLRIASTDRVVEVGCGIGRMTRELAGRAAHVVGLDVSAEMIARARRELNALSNVELLEGNGSDLGGIADASVDVVYSLIVFQHIPDPSITCGYIREIGRVLRPGGWTVFQVSERPEMHVAGSHRRDRGVRATVGRVRGHRPRGTLRREWLGSAVPRTDLLAALADGGLELSGTVGDGTQYCLVHAVRA